MNEKTMLTEAEAKIMRLLWQRSPQTMMELTRALESETHWTKYTVITLLKRMAQKGTVRIDESGAVKTYAPAVEKATVAGEQTDRLLKHMYAGKPTLLMSALVERGNISDSELAEMMEIIGRASRR